jgi:DNA-binding transcriptional LysR family regulator
VHTRFLKIYCDIVRQHSFSKAADLNGISQSNASQIVHQLEERLGVTLIDRSKRPFVLTAEGERFYEGCRGIVRRYNDLEREVRSLHESVSAPLRMASIYSVGLAHMSQCLREFLAAHPRADVRVEYMHPDRVYEVVEADEADLGVVSYPEDSRLLATTAWRSEPLVVVCAPEHRFAGVSDLPVRDLDGEPFIALEGGLRLRDEIDNALARRKVTVRVEQEFDNIEVIKRAIETNAGVSLLPGPTVAREVAAGTLVQLPLSDVSLTRPLGLIHRRDRELSDTARAFIELLQSHAHDAAEIAARSGNGKLSYALSASNGHN